jgi:hypothetical protein
LLKALQVVLLHGNGLCFFSFRLLKAAFVVVIFKEKKDVVNNRINCAYKERETFCITTKRALNYLLLFIRDFLLLQNNNNNNRVGGEAITTFATLADKAKKNYYNKIIIIWHWY